MLSFQENLLKLKMVLSRLSTTGIIKNLIISPNLLFSEQIEYLGYWITIQDILPIRSMVEIKAFLNIKAP
jgi:hypothetical protein